MPGFLPIDVVCILGKIQDNCERNRKSQDYKRIPEMKTHGFQRQQKAMDIRISIAWQVVDDEMLTIQKELFTGVLQQKSTFI